MWKFSRDNAIWNNRSMLILWNGFRSLSICVKCAKFAPTTFSDSWSWLKLYTRFQCYVHRRHLCSSFDMLCNLAEIKMLTQRTLLWSNSTFSDKINMDLFVINLRLGVSRSHFVGDKLTVLNVYIVRILARYQPYSTRSHHWAADRLHTNRLIIL